MPLLTELSLWELDFCYKHVAPNGASVRPFKQCLTSSGETEAIQLCRNFGELGTAQNRLLLPEVLLQLAVADNGNVRFGGRLVDLPIANKYDQRFDQILRW